MGAYGRDSSTITLKRQRGGLEIELNKVLACAAALALLTGLGSAVAGELACTVKDAAGHGVQDAVVYAMPVTTGQVPAAAKADGKGVRPQAAMDQVNKEFVPHVLAVQVGTEVRFPNRDNVHHHVYSLSSAKTFDLPLYKNTTPPPLVFAEPGVVTLGCNIHDWMLGYVVVVDTPFFAKTGAEGFAKIEGIPAGDYEVHVWHAGLRSRSEPAPRRVRVGPELETPAAHVLDVEPERVRRRGSAAPGGGYR